MKRKRHLSNVNKMMLAGLTLAVLLILVIAIGFLRWRAGDSNRPCDGTPENVYVDWINFGQSDATTEIYGLCSDGRVVNLSNSTERENNPILSPDKTLIAYDRTTSGPSQVWVMNIDGSDQRQVSSYAQGSNLIRWLSNDEVLYRSTRNGVCLHYSNDMSGNDEQPFTNCP